MIRCKRRSLIHPFGLGNQLLDQINHEFVLYSLSRLHEYLDPLYLDSKSRYTSDFREVIDHVTFQIV